MDPDTVRLSVVSRHHTKEKALAGEALAAARFISEQPDLARGGPWCRARLSKSDFEEMAKVLKCSTLQQVSEIPGHGPLEKHLQDLAFGRRAWQPRPAVGVSTRPSGSQKRKRKGMKHGDQDWERLKWGSSDPEGSRKQAQDLYNGTRPNRPRR